MNKYRKYIPIIGVILVALGAGLERFGIDLTALLGQGSSTSQTSTSQSGGDCDGGAAGQHWSNTSPQINLFHVFEGEINRKGKPTGYHSRPCGSDPSGARVVSVKDKPNSAGVYTANIEVRDGNQWKSKFSSFFPDSMSRDEVIDVILHAYNNSSNPKKQPWSGPSGKGFEVQGYTSGKGGINTAFPIYRKNQ